MKNTKNLAFLLLTSTALFYCSCDTTDNKLKIFNDTQKNFYYKLKKDSVLLIKDVNYINEELKFAVANIQDTCIPTFAFKNHGGYERKINTECVDSTMFLYLFEIDSVKKFGWQKIIRNDNLHYRTGFKVKSLDSLKWFIRLSKVFGQ